VRFLRKPYTFEQLLAAIHAEVSAEVRTPAARQTA